MQTERRRDGKNARPIKTEEDAPVRSAGRPSPQPSTCNRYTASFLPLSRACVILSIRGAGQVGLTGFFCLERGLGEGAQVEERCFAPIYWEAGGAV